MLQVIKPSASDSKEINWPQTWRDSDEFKAVKKELDRLRALNGLTPAADEYTDGEDSQHREYVTSIWTQFWHVLVRTAKHFWRSPTYIWSKFILIVLSVSGESSILKSILKSCPSFANRNLPVALSRL